MLTIQRNSRQPLLQPKRFASLKHCRHGFKLSISAGQPARRRGKATPPLAEVAAFEAHPPIVGIGIARSQQFGQVIGVIGVVAAAQKNIAARGESTGRFVAPGFGVRLIGLLASQAIDAGGRCRRYRLRR